MGDAATPDVGAPQGQEDGWRGELALRFAAERDGLGSWETRLVERRHRGPLVVQRPFYPEDRRVPHVYILHPPGGLVGGDRLSLDVTAGPRAHALLTTPAATKVYRSAGPAASQLLRFQIEAGACLEWLPQETILHDGAHAELSAEVRLEGGDARFIGLDTLCFGLPARGETFATGRCRQRFEIWLEGRPIFIERGHFDADDPVHGAAWGLGGARVNGLMVVAPARKTLAVVPRLRDAASQVAPPARAGVSVLGEGQALICRYLGPSVERARQFFQAVWTIVRPELTGLPAVPPRIWAT